MRSLFHSFSLSLSLPLSFIRKRMNNSPEAILYSQCDARYWFVLSTRARYSSGPCRRPKRKGQVTPRHKPSAPGVASTTALQATAARAKWQVVRFGSSHWAYMCYICVCICVVYMCVKARLYVRLCGCVYISLLLSMYITRN